MKIKRIYFMCLNTTNFFSVLYYMQRVKWDEHMKKILVWAKEGKTRPEIEPYRDIFDEIIYMDFAEYRFLGVRLQLDKFLKAGRLFFISKLGRFMKESVTGNMLVCFNDSEYCTTKCMDFLSRYDNNEIVMLDEGTALYFDQMINPPTKAAYIVNWILGTRLNTSVGTDPKIDVLMARQPDRLPSSKKCGHRVIPQNDIFRDAEFLQQIQKQIACRLPEKKGRRVLWLGQPLEQVRLGNYQEEALIDIFRTFIEKGYRILVKPHPRESSGKYLRAAQTAGIEKYLTILDLGELYWIPIEAYAELLAPEAVACFFSTAAGRIRDMGYICNTWYCFDFLKADLEDDYLQKEADYPHTFRVHNRKELEETLSDQDRIPWTGGMSGRDKMQKINRNLDIAYFEQFGEEKDIHE